MPPKSRSLRLALMLLPPIALAAACSSVSPPLPPAVVRPALIPPLPVQARQPALPEFCSPTCSAALTRERDSLLPSATPAAPPARPASAATTR